MRHGSVKKREERDGKRQNARNHYESERESEREREREREKEEGEVNRYVAGHLAVWPAVWLTGWLAGWLAAWFSSSSRVIKFHGKRMVGKSFFASKFLRSWNSRILVLKLQSNATCVSKCLFFDLKFGFFLSLLKFFFLSVSHPKILRSQETKFFRWT